MVHCSSILASASSSPIFPIYNQLALKYLLIHILIMASQVRQSILSLYDFIRTANTNEALSNEPVVPAQFFRANPVRLAPLEMPDRWSSSSPPVMFRYFPDFGVCYPIDQQRTNSDLMPKFVEYDPSKSLMDSGTRPTYLAQYIDKWAEGSEIPRRLPQGVPKKTLYELRGVRPV